MKRKVDVICLWLKTAAKMLEECLARTFHMVHLFLGQRTVQPEVVTKCGRLQGKLAQVEGVDQPVNVFLGIPFAKPPVGPLRFSPPQPAEPWNNVREATHFPPVCLQHLEWMSAIKKAMNTKFPILTVSEDCLYLNVFTPDMTAKLPVMVWIHGGGLVIGGASIYDGSALSAYGNVVVVTIQYRLGLPGFFRKHLKAQQPFFCSLCQAVWEKNEAGPFTMEHNFLLSILSPLAKGLFHRAISESGVAQIPGLFTNYPEVFAEKVADLSGCEKSHPGMLQCLRSKTEEDLRILNEVGIVPAVVDGEFIPKAPEVLLAAKEFSTVPYLTGVNNNEYGWLLPQVSKRNLSSVTCPSLQNLPLESVTMALEEYLGDTEDRATLRDSFQDLMGDILFVVPALQVARYHRDSGAPVYFYEFQHRPTAFKDIKPSFVKADHGDELVFVFGGPFLRIESTEGEKDLSRRIMKYWANFAHHGDPNGEGLMEWPRYDLDEQYLELNLKQRKAEKLKKSRVDFWLKTLPEKMKKITEERKIHEEL
uniref:Carboxylesterase type B domain-containing protein n=1 Tax=Salvator merianae TaxID=96440 RepID=A0A8D0E298_SALMN